MEKRGESTLFMKCRKRVEGHDFNAIRRHLVPSREAHKRSGRAEVSLVDEVHEDIRKYRRDDIVGEVR